MGWASLRELHWLFGDGFLRWAFIITILGRSWRNCRPIRSMDLWSPLPPSGGSNMNTSNVALLLSCFWPYITIPTAPVFFTQTCVNFWASHAVEPHGGRRAGQQHAIDEPALVHELSSVRGIRGCQLPGKNLRDGVPLRHGNSNDADDHHCCFPYWHHLVMAGLIKIEFIYVYIYILSGLAPQTLPLHSLKV